MQAMPGKGWYLCLCAGQRRPHPLIQDEHCLAHVLGPLLAKVLGLQYNTLKAKQCWTPSLKSQATTFLSDDGGGHIMYT